MNPHLSLLVQELGAFVGIPDLALEDNSCVLSFDEVLLSIEYAEATDTLLVFAPVGALPPGDREPLYQQLLQSNLFGRDTSGAWFAVSMESKQVVLQQQFSVAVLTVPVFLEALETFVNTCERWSSWFTGGRENPPTNQEEVMGAGGIFNANQLV